MGKNDNKLRLGKVLHYFDKLPSTNDYALQLLAKNAPEEGSVVVTWEQTEGRGRRGRSWFTGSDKNIALSVILYPQFLNLNDQFYLNKFVSVAIADALLELDIDDVSIKWPNDLYIGERKVGGILVQNNIHKDRILSCIIGVGLNVNQGEFPDYLPNPTSLFVETGFRYDLKEILHHLLNKLTVYYTELTLGRKSELEKFYLKRLFRKQGIHSFRTSNGKVIQGNVGYVNNRGEIVIVTKEGQKANFSFNEIEFL